ncbi:FecR family protein [Alistipes sp.]|uniref:FecR family protein n=1 Tax=Alistipes sp. TaxID=1872444 RepID=UPI003AEFB6A2
MQTEKIDRYVRGEAAPDERKEVEEWILQDDRNLHEVHAASMAYFAAVVHAPEPQAFRTPRFAILRQRLARYAVQAAAVLALSAGVGYLVAHRTLGRWAERTMTLRVPAGKTLDVVLPDGTAVSLNAGTTIEYPPVFARSERRVKLAGEALFRVEHDARHPFVVETFACDVEVLGTEFDVAADAERGTFSAALFRGSVKVTDRNGGEQLILRPDERVHLAGGRLCRHAITDRAEYLWPDGIVNIAGLGFEELMARFERVFGVRIEIRCEKIPDVNFLSGKLYVSEGIDNALRNLQMGAAFRFERDPETNTVTIF